MAQSIFQPVLSEPRGASGGAPTEPVDTSVGEGLSAVGSLLENMADAKLVQRKQQLELQEAQNEASVIGAAADFQQALEERRQGLDTLLKTGVKINPDDSEEVKSIKRQGNKIFRSLRQGVYSETAARSTALTIGKSLLDKYPGQADLIRQLFISPGDDNVISAVDVVDPITEESVEFLNATRGNTWSPDDLRRERTRRIVHAESNVKFANADADEFHNIQATNMSTSLQPMWESLSEALVEQQGAVTEAQATRFNTAVDSVVQNQIAALDQWIEGQRSQGVMVSAEKYAQMRQQIIRHGQSYKNLLTGEGERGGQSRLLRDKLAAYNQASKELTKAKSGYEHLALLADVVNKLDGSGTVTLNNMLSLSDTQLEQIVDMFPGQFEGLEGTQITAAGVRAKIVQGLNRIVGAEEVPTGWEGFHQMWVAKKARVPNAEVNEVEANNFMSLLEDERFEARNVVDTLDAMENVIDKANGKLSTENKQKINSRLRNSLYRTLRQIRDSGIKVEVTDLGIAIPMEEEDTGGIPVPSFSGGEPVPEGIQSANRILNFVREHPEIMGSHERRLEEVREILIGEEEEEGVQPTSTPTPRDPLTLITPEVRQNLTDAVTMEEKREVLRGIGMSEEEINRLVDMALQFTSQLNVPNEGG